jgi:hypothetical protein
LISGSEAPVFHAINIGTTVFAGLIVLIPGVPLLTIALNANLLAMILMPQHWSGSLALARMAARDAKQDLSVPPYRHL